MIRDTTFNSGEASKTCGALTESEFRKVHSVGVAARVFANLGHVNKCLESIVREVRVSYSTLKSQSSISILGAICQEGYWYPRT